MINKRHLLAIVVLLVISIFGISLYVAPHPVINAYHNTEVYKTGLPMYKNDIYDATLKASTHVVLGSVLSIEPAEGYNTTDNATISVKELLKGEFNEDTISVLIDKNVIEKGAEYIFFINRNCNTAYSKPMNSVFSSFVIEVERTGKIKAVTSLTSKKYSDIFSQQQFNNLQYVKDYIREIKDKPGSRKTTVIIEKSESLKQLFSISKYVALIELHDVEHRKFGDGNSVAIARYKVLNLYKGSFPETAVSIMLPTYVKEGGKYLLYLNETEYSTIVPTTKEDSIYQEGTTEYEKAIKSID